MTAVAALVQTPSKRVVKSGVRRCLFGIPEHDSLVKFFYETNQRLDEVARKRWNFDFRKDTPLSGQYVWERFTPATRADCPKTPTKNASGTTGCMPDRELRILNDKNIGSSVSPRHMKQLDCKRRRWCPTVDTSTSNPAIGNVEKTARLSTAEHGGAPGAENDTISSSLLSSKRKQSTISDFFPRKKCRTDILRAKRRLDL